MQRPFARWSARLLLDLLGNALDELTEGLHLHELNVANVCKVDSTESIIGMPFRGAAFAAAPEKERLLVVGYSSRLQGVFNRCV